MADLVLSRLKEESNITKIAPGQWDSQDNGAFKDVADSLAYEAPGQIKSVSSVPTMWARPLIVQMALFDQNHPIHKQIVRQWRGMLAAIALAEVEGFDLKVELIDLNNEQYFNFGKALYELMPPKDVNVLYTRENKNPWAETYVFLWNGKPAGMSSPSTLVCPAEEGIWDGLRWWNEKDQAMNSPEEYLSPEAKGLLWRWLENIQQGLIRYGGTQNAVEKAIALMKDFKNSLGVDAQSAPELSLSSEEQFFGLPLNIGALELINKPIQAPPQPSNVVLIPSVGKEDLPPLLVIDENIADYWRVEPQNVWIYENKTLASLNLQDLKDGSVIWQDAQGRRVKWIESSDLFLPEFRFIDRLDALEDWALLPQTNPPLMWNEKEITPLLPLNPILLEYFTPEDLLTKVQLKPFSNVRGKGITFTLDLPLKGVKTDNKSQNYRLEKEYLLKEENAIKEIPILAVWPNFVSPTWRKYYTYYYDGGAGNNTFQAYFPQEDPEDTPRMFTSEQGGYYELTTIKQFPNYIVCQEADGTKTAIGLILLKSLISKKPVDNWKIGVDFGTSFTNIYYKTPNSTEMPLPMDKLLANITNTSLQTRIPALIENFIPQDFLPTEEPLPVSTVLTTKDGKENEKKLAPIYDGRIYVPDVEIFDPGKTHIKVNLKWLTEKNNSGDAQPLKYNRSFIQNVALLASANAANCGAKKIDWCISYPTAFSTNDTLTYHDNWKKISKELENITGLEYTCPKYDDHTRFCTESVALAQYFNDKEDHPLLRTTCIDMGGGTSDISIWENRGIVYQCSVLFAGRDIFSQFLAMNTKFAEEHLFEEDSSWSSLGKQSFLTKLDVWLRNKAELWLEEEKVSQLGNAYFQRLITLTALGTAGLYYYVGMTLKILHQQEKFSKSEITSVYIGGNGSRFLHWLSPTGKFNKNVDFNKLLSRMLARGSEFEDKRKQTQLSENPKHEVACGLILDQTKLTGINEDEDQHPFAGENYEVEYIDEDQESHTKSLTWDSRLVLEGNVTQFKISDLDNLKLFLYEFHQALSDLKISSVKPLISSDYRPQKPETKEQSEDDSSEPKADKNSQLWQDVQDHLDNVLLNIEGSAEDIRPEPPFILGLKSLLNVLGKRWADDYKN